MTPDEIKQVADGFNINYNNPEIIKYVFNNSYVHDSVIHALITLVIENLSEITDKSYDEIYKQFLEILDKTQKETIAEVLTKFGEIGQKPPSTL